MANQEVEARIGEWIKFRPGIGCVILSGEEFLWMCSQCTAKYADVSGFRFCPRYGNPTEKGGGEK